MKKLISMIIIFLLMIVIQFSCDNDSSDESINNSKPLSWMEEQVAQKWSRYHGYDGSTEYLILKDNRSGCYFEITSSGTRRNNKCYINWYLDEDNPVAENVFNIMVMTSSNSPYNIGEFHYTYDEIWRGGYSELSMYPSTSFRECECNN